VKEIELPVPPGVATLHSRSVLRGRVLDVRVDRVRFPDGSEGEMEVVRHRGAAAVLPVYRRGDRGRESAAVLLVRQFRYAAGGTLWEIPAGKLDGGETPESCAKRELEEECGVRATRLVPLATVLTTPGFSDERVHLFLGLDLEPGEAALEAHEFLERKELAFDEALGLVESGELVDAKSVIALLQAQRLRPAWERGGDDRSGNDAVFGSV
jgi:ADP-ribose pyrophosphatase